MWITYFKNNSINVLLFDKRYYLCFIKVNHTLKNIHMKKYQAIIIGTYISREIFAKDLKVARFMAKDWMTGIMFLPVNMRVKIIELAY